MKKQKDPKAEIDSAWMMYSGALKLDENDPEGNIKKLVTESVKTLDEIDLRKQTWLDDCYENAVKNIQRPFSKAVWRRMVRFKSREVLGTLTEKSREKLEDMYYQYAADAAMLHNMVYGTGPDSYTKTVNDTTVGHNPVETADSDFNAALLTAVDAYNEIEETLKPRNNIYMTVARHENCGSMDPDAFKTLVKYIQSKDKTEPDGTVKKSGAWELVKKFNDTYRVFNEHGYSKIADICKNFKLQVKAE